MKTFISADLHFYHKNIIKFQPLSRPFENVEQMNEEIVKRWNSVVSDKDVTFVLGDVAFSSLTKTFEIVDRLNGAKILVAGNHDRQIVEAKDVLQHFYSVHDYLEMKHNGHSIRMFHFPIYEWSNMHHGAIHFHGHLHTKPTGIEGRIKDVCLDGNNLYPYNMDDLIKEMLLLPIRKHGDTTGDME